ncbi:hypothetical protein P280DRAFT_485487 [Massarina eburnea CBS 473.64]|uniref:RING-type domain-containing protein n=1 Tax=Massarina eburnea CBS 473.64 TaxID=1395130 RepID=A0A6A6RHE3_9PLEO|nr:hypothetical protein P280DRAFT_485487 [Massarina eburnea CBS 473.64]
MASFIKKLISGDPAPSIPVPIFTQLFRQAKNRQYQTIEYIIQELADLAEELNEQYVILGFSIGNSYDRLADPNFVDLRYRASCEADRHQMRIAIRESVQAENISLEDFIRTLINGIALIPSKIRTPGRRRPWATGRRPWSESWALQCAIHPEADTDGSVGQWLCKYLDHFPKMNLSPSDFARQVKYAKKHDIPFLSLRTSLRMLRGSSKRGLQVYHDDIFAVLHVYFRLSMYAVDIFRWFYNGTTESITDKYQVLYMVTCENILGTIMDPFAKAYCINSATGELSAVSISAEVKTVIAKINVEGTMSYLMHILQELKGQGSPNTELGWLLCNFIVTSADHKTADTDNTVRSIASRFFHPNDSHDDFRPLGVPFDLIGTVTENTDIEFEPTSLADAVAASGPRIDAKRLGTITDSPQDDLECGICTEKVCDEVPDEHGEAGLDGVLKLEACGHHFHVACIDSFVNGAFPNKAKVQCPLCRSDICDPRPVSMRD